jgi:hypothetical protein
VQRADVHRHLGRFEVQERGVEAGQLLHAHSVAGVAAMLGRA